VTPVDGRAEALSQETVNIVRILALWRKSASLPQKPCAPTKEDE
jgi:hypothetical protein